MDDVPSALPSTLPSTGNIMASKVAVNIAYNLTERAELVFFRNHSTSLMSFLCFIFNQALFILRRMAASILRLTLH